MKSVVEYERMCFNLEKEREREREGEGGDGYKKTQIFSSRMGDIG